MNVKVIVFDFDGTLILSNPLKYNSYFKIFPDNNGYKKTIKSVLDKYFEQSRYFIIRKVLELVNFNNEAIEDEIIKLANNYNDIVVSEIGNCNERKNATEILGKLKDKYKLYINSNTPEKVLINTIKFRKWDVFFSGIFGYPRKKEETLKEILAKEKINKNEMIFIGDGKSDEVAAEKAEVNYLNIERFEMSDLLELEKINVFK